MASSSKRSRASHEPTDPKTIVADKNIEVTKFVDLPILDKLGLGRVTREMFDKAGLGGFLDKFAATHPNLTRAFLTTMKPVYSEGTYVRSLRFTYHKRTYTATLEQMRDAFGVTKQDNWDDSVTNDVVTDWWEDMTGIVFDHKNETDTKVNFPPLRIIHKIIAMCFAGKGETNKVSKVQLFLMYPFALECNYYPCWVSEFVKSCVECRTLKGGDISQGGMITLVALAAGVPQTVLDRDPPPVGTIAYDEDWWYVHGWLKWREPVKRRWLYRYGPKFKFGVWYPRSEEVRLLHSGDMWIEPDVFPKFAEADYGYEASGSRRRPREDDVPMDDVPTGGVPLVDVQPEQDEPRREDIHDLAARLGRVEVSVQSLVSWSGEFDQRQEAHWAQQNVVGNSPHRSLPARRRYSRPGGTASHAVSLVWSHEDDVEL
ncbi:hypothetical protein V2J09_000810 [Rumex salicifolius]